MSDQTEYDSAFKAGTEQSLKLIDIKGIQHALIPNHTNLKSFEKLMPAPQRIVASPRFSDEEGFSEYFNEFKEEGTRIFVDDLKMVFTTVFDCHKKGVPQWGDHSSSYKLHYSSEWERFKELNNCKTDQKEFALFLEDNAEYITGPFTALELLTLAQNINVDFKGTLDIEETISRGLKSLTIKDDSRAFGFDSAGKKIEFPDSLTLSLRVYKNGPLYDFNVKLRQRISKDKNCLIFWITITDPSAIEEAAFDKVIASVEESTGVRPLRGAYEGDYHKRR